jgi:outer membrane protein OmpA-like peptidoglycan-associated protein/tetratricopeptide (TPR) repeat protein
MKPLSYCIAFLLFFCIAENIHAQSSELRKANKEFDSGEYFQALEYYKAAEQAGLKPDLETQKRIARCYYYLNSIDKAFELFSDFHDKLEGHDIFLYANICQRVELYEDAITWYEKSKKANEDPLMVGALIKGCQWALANSTLTNVLANPTSLLTFGQSFGVQYYKNSVVYSSADESKSNKNVDKQGMSFLNLFYSDIVNGDIQSTKKLFSEKLVFPFHVGAICFSSDLNTMYFTKSVLVKGGRNVMKIFVVRKEGNDWGEQKELSFNSNDYDCAMPAISRDGKYLYFVSNKPGGIGGKDIYFAEIKKNDNFGEVKNVGNSVNTFGNEVFPVINPDNKLYFSSDGHYGFGGWDIFSSEYIDGKWTNITNLLQPINSRYDDFCYVLDPNDLTTGILSSNRGGDGTKDYILMVKPKVENKDTTEDIRPIIGLEMLKTTPDTAKKVIETVPAIENGLPTAISSLLTSTFKGTVISGASIIVKDPTTGEIIGQATTDEKGSFVINIDEKYRKEDQEFEIEISKGNEFKPKKLIVNIKEIEDLRKNGITLTPVFNDQVLDDIGGMTIPYVGNEITAEGYKTLDRLAVYLLSNPNIVVKLNGHTDARGNRFINLTISQQVAEKAEMYLKSKGVNDINMIPRGYAERYLLNKCRRGVYCDDAEHLKNRRVEVVVWKRLNQ